MLQGDDSAILLPFIKLPFVIKIFVLSFSERPFCTGFAVPYVNVSKINGSSLVLHIPLSKCSPNVLKNKAPYCVTSVCTDT